MRTKIILSTVLVLIAIATWVSWPQLQPATPIPNAIRLATLAQPQVADLQNAYCPYAWLSSAGGVLLQRANGGITMSGTFGSVTASSVDATSFAPDGILPAKVVSPNGKFLLCHDDQGYDLASVDGKYRFRTAVLAGGRATPDEVLLWLPDSRHWAVINEVAHKAYIRVYDRLTPAVTQRTEDFMPSYYQFAGISNDVAYGFTKYVGDGSVTVVKADVSPSRSGSRQIFFMPVPPFVYGDYEVALSPDGQRLAWIFLETRPPLGISALNHIRISSRLPITASALWISNVDGSNMHRIGGVGFDLLAHQQSNVTWSTENRMLRGLSWCPDGKHVSFVYRGELWSVPV